MQIVVLPLITAYLVFNFIPAQWYWFEPSTPQFEDAPSDGIPKLVYDRDIKIPTRIRYTAVVRRISPHAVETETGDYDPPGVVACEGTSGIIPYKATYGPVVGKDIAWWVPQDFRCRVLPDGLYWAETCWTLTNPLGDLLNYYLGLRTTRFLGPLAPQTTICETTSVFTVGDVKP